MVKTVAENCFFVVVNKFLMADTLCVFPSIGSRLCRWTTKKQWFFKSVKDSKAESLPNQEVKSVFILDGSCGEDNSSGSIIWLSPCTCALLFFAPSSGMPWTSFVPEINAWSSLKSESIRCCNLLNVCCECIRTYNISASNKQLSFCSLSTTDAAHCWTLPSRCATA